MDRNDKLVRRLLRSSSFCGCVPVRAGFVLTTLITFLLAGAISIIIWFEIYHSYPFQFTTKERVAFYLTGIVETVLFVLSAVGFVGVVASKQLFVMMYTYFLYLHFILNLIVGIYFLVSVRKSNREQLVDYCSRVFDNTSVGPSCTKLMNVSTYVFIAIVAALLFFELYGALIATRYVYRLRMQKRENRSRRLGYFHALSAPGTRHARQASDNIELLNPQESTAVFEDDVIDIRPPMYTPVSTHDQDGSGSGVRRVRALPPRPSEQVTHALPNPHEASNIRRSSESDDERRSQYTSEVSTSAHAALMDHAAYIETRFSSAPALPRRTLR